MGKERRGENLERKGRREEKGREGKRGVRKGKGLERKGKKRREERKKEDLVSCSFGKLGKVLMKWNWGEDKDSDFRNRIGLVRV